MLTKLHLKNFKAWKDTGPIRLAPLTIIFGANSAGKSSLGHLLLALKQTALSTDRKRALHLGDTSTLIDLGTFSDCLNGHDLSKSLEFELGWTLPKAMDLHLQEYLLPDRMVSPLPGRTMNPPTNSPPGPPFPPNPTMTSSSNSSSPS